MSNQRKSAILAVDDEPVTLALVERNLLKAGFHVVTAKNGAEGLDLLKKEKVDLILCDIMMPDIDGYEFRERMKKSANIQNLPFIFLTAQDQPGDEVKGLQTGVDEYIKKPFDPLILIARVQAVIERHKAAMEREEIILDLREALAKVKTLSGLLPICANCKKIRDDKGYWNQIDEYIRSHSDVDFSHCICPVCAKKLYPEMYDKIYKS